MCGWKGYTFQASEYMNGYHFHIKSMEISYPGEFVPRIIRTKNEWVRILWLIRTQVRINQTIRTLHLIFVFNYIEYG